MHGLNNLFYNMSCNRSKRLNKKIIKLTNKQTIGQPNKPTNKQTTYFLLIESVV
jgi:hypothetical protein